MKIGCGTVCFRKLSLIEALKRIKIAGYDYVELQATIPFCPHIDVDKDDPEKINELIKNYGFKEATALWSTHGAIIPDDLSVEYIVKCIKWAKKANIPVINVGDGFKPENMSEEEAWGLLKDRILKILITAEENEIYLAIEPHGTFSFTAYGLQRIMEISNSNWLGINYDTANIHMATCIETKDGAYTWKFMGERQNEVETLEKIVDKVVHVHVKDVIGTECVSLGSGEVNIKGCIGVLRNANYKGAISLETEGEVDPEDAQKLIENSRKYLLNLLEA
jgi:sugar phosphate isomerase/epimerase